MTSVPLLLAACLLVTAALIQPIRGTCPNSGVCDNCQANSSCVTFAYKQSCQCDAGFEGAPNFNCYEPYHKRTCYVLSDPDTRSLNGFYAHTHFFGSAKLVHVITDSYHGSGGKCHLRLYGWTTKVLGKFYLKGLFFRMNYTPNGGTRERIIGGVYGNETGCHTVFYYFLKSSIDDIKGFVATTTPAGTHVDGGTGPCAFQFHMIDGGFLQISNECCGIKFALRTFHSYYPERVPGMFFEVCLKHYPTFNCWNIAPLCLEISETGANFTTLRGYTDITDPDAALTYHAMTSTPYKGYPSAPIYLGAVKSHLLTCTYSRLNLMFAEAGFFFFSPHFIRCIADDDDDYSLALNLLLQFYCEDDAAKCTSLLDRIIARCTNQFHKINVSIFFGRSCGNIA